MFLSACSPMSSKVSSSFSRGILLHARRYADAAGFGQCFQPSGDVHAVAKDVAILDHDVAHIDANAQLDTPVIGHSGIALGYTSLHLSRNAEHPPRCRTRRASRLLSS